MASFTFKDAANTTQSSDAQLLASGAYVETVRELAANTMAPPTIWTILATAATSVIGADATRRTAILINGSGSATVYIRYDATGPTVTVGGYHDAIAPGQRLVVEKELVTFPVSMIGSTGNSGALNIALATAA